MRHGPSTWLIVTLLFVALPPAYAQKVRWDNGDGGSNTIDSATWNDLQAAITNAEQGAATVGTVKISGDYLRASNDVAVGDLEITRGNIRISGGWSSDFLAQSGKSTLNGNGSNTAGNQFRVLTVAGTNVGFSSFIVTGGSLPDTSGAGVLVQTNDVTLSDLVVSNNAANGFYSSSGGGISVVGCVDVRIHRCVVAANYAGLAGGGIHVAQWAGVEGHPIRIEYCDVRDNWTADQRSGGGLFVGDQTGGGCYDYVIVASCRITGNRSYSGAGFYSGAYRSQTQIVFFNCLVQGNRGVGASSTGMATSKSSKSRTHVVNCTVVDNVNTDDSAQKGIYAGTGSWGEDSYLRFVNSIVSTNNGMFVYARNRGSGGAGGHIELQRTTTGERIYEEADSAYPTETATNFAAALLFSDPGFHSVNDWGITTTNMEQNIQGDPGFLAKPGRMYWLTGTSNSRNNALTRTEGGGPSAYTYVDVNANGAYDALLDVIVDGTPPAGEHYVYKHDLTVLDQVLAGASLATLKPNRVIERKLDRGAFEFVPPAGTVVFLR
jgi:hypothetical protein